MGLEKSNSMHAGALDLNVVAGDLRNKRSDKGYIVKNDSFDLKNCIDLFVRVTGLKRRVMQISIGQ
jgi:hypothetical protein